MKTPPLSDADLQTALAALPGWTHEGNCLCRTFAFKNFRQAMAFMVRASYEAEELNHHPDWTNVYRTVSVRLSTHDSGGVVTAKDVSLAKRFEALPLS